jgi:hypothetical protein
MDPDEQLQFALFVTEQSEYEQRSNPAITRWAWSILDTATRPTKFKFARRTNDPKSA